MNLHDASGAPCLGIATNIRDGSLSAVDAAIVNWVSETDYLADCNALPIALSISLPIFVLTLRWATTVASNALLTLATQAHILSIYDIHKIDVGI